MGLLGSQVRRHLLIKEVHRHAHPRPTISWDGIVVGSGCLGGFVVGCVYHAGGLLCGGFVVMWFCRRGGLSGVGLLLYH